MIFFTTEFAKNTLRTRRDFNRVRVIRFLITKMLNQVQHDGRVGISGFSENIINNRHPGLVSGSLLILGWSSMGMVKQNEEIGLETALRFFVRLRIP